MRFLWLAAALFLAACASGPQPGPPQPPSPEPRPGSLYFSASWTAPSIGLGGHCTGDVPPICTGDTPWLGFNPLCMDPAPNACYSADGVNLTYTAPDPGFGIISNRTFSKDGTISVEAVVSFTCNDPPPTDDVCYTGVATWNGELNYRSLYAYSGQGQPPGTYLIAMFGPTHMQPLSDKLYEAGETHALRTDYVGGVWRYYVDGVLMLTETPGSLSTDGTVMLNDPHAALWLGAGRGSVGRMDVFTGN